MGGKEQTTPFLSYMTGYTGLDKVQLVSCVPWREGDEHDPARHIKHILPRSIALVRQQSTASTDLLWLDSLTVCIERRKMQSMAHSGSYLSYVLILDNVQEAP